MKYQTKACSAPSGFGPENGREYDTRKQEIGDVEVGADYGAPVERAAVAAAADVRRYAHAAIGEQSTIANLQSMVRTERN